MADAQTVEGLLEGAWDTHIHSGPDVLPRKFEDLDLAKRFVDHKMGGFVLKSHYICTADRAHLINRSFPEVKAFGGLALNNSVGGLNPLACDIAGRLGNKVVWLPTVDSKNELDAIANQTDETKLPYWMPIARELRAMGIAGVWLEVTEDGKPTEKLRQCLEVIAKYDMVLATGHIRPDEMLPVVKAAKEVGVQRIVITHPEFPTTLLSVEQQKELAKYDVFFERCFTTPHNKRTTWDHTIDNIRQVGISTTIVATDLGQTTNPYVDEGLKMYYGNLLDAGFSEKDVKQMGTHNPAQVLGVA